MLISTVKMLHLKVDEYVAQYQLFKHYAKAGSGDSNFCEGHNMILMTIIVVRTVLSQTAKKCYSVSVSVNSYHTHSNCSLCISLQVLSCREHCQYLEVIVSIEWL